MATISLKADPTFRAKVPIPMPGKDPVEVEFEFKHRTEEALNEFVRGLDGLKNTDYVLAVAVSWELKDQFNRESIELLLQNYHGAPEAIARTYMRELMQGKRGN